VTRPSFFLPAALAQGLRPTPYKGVLSVARGGVAGVQKPHHGSDPAMNLTLNVDKDLLSRLRNDERLSGSDQDRVTQALHAYLRAEAGRRLIDVGGQAPGMEDVARR